MHSSPEFTSNIAASLSAGGDKPTRGATIAYQGVTIAAMLLLLGTMWVF